VTLLAIARFSYSASNAVSGEVERKSSDGCGEGNFRALFDAIERDQIHRGVLSPRS
jgi:4-hydroxyphenylpyruvate dioxygenase-like putative hemolysin